MLKFALIGNLGSDARIEENNGHKFVSFNVAHNDRYQGANGAVHESITWVSCALNGDGGKLLPFLVKGRQVYVEGKGSTRVYSSPTLRRMVAGLNISVDRIELIGGQVDAVPRSLVDGDGALHSVNKAFFIDLEEAKNLGAKKNAPITLNATDGRMFSVDYLGWITPVSPEPTGEAQQGEQNS